jgi:hypothetical protein
MGSLLQTCRKALRRETLWRALRSQRPPLALLLLCPLVLVSWTLNAARPPAQFPLDLIPTYLAGKLWLAGQPEAVYHDGAWLPASGANPEWHAMAQVSGIQMPDTAFTYSPVYLGLWLPLVAVLRPLHFYWTFATLSALSALVLGWESARLAGVEKPWVKAVVALLVALSFPCSYAGMLGQNVVMAALLVLLGFRAFDRGQSAVGVTLLVLASAFKAWCVLFVLALVLARRWRDAALFGATWLATMILLPRQVLPAALVDGFDRVVSTLPEISVLAFNNVSLRALIHRLSLEDWTTEAWSWSKHGLVEGPEFAVEIALVLGVGALYWLLVRLRAPSFRALYTESMALALVTLGVCWSHYLVFALPLLVCTVLKRELPWTVRGLGLVLGLWVWHLMSAAAPILPMMRPPGLWAFIYSAPLLLSVALPVALASVRTRQHDANGASVQSKPEQPIDTGTLELGRELRKHVETRVG